MKDNEFKTLDQLEAELETAKKQYEDAQKSVTKKKAEEADRKKAELALVKEKRRMEIEDTEKKLNELYTAYLKDYGSIEWRMSNSEDDDSLLSYLLRHHLFF